MPKDTEQRSRLLAPAGTRLLLGLTITALFSSCAARTDKSDERLTSRTIQLVRTGSTVEEVLELLGRPYVYKSNGGNHSNTCTKPREFHRVFRTPGELRSFVNRFFTDTNHCCVGNREFLTGRKGIMLEYTRKTDAWLYAMLRVGLDSNCLVRSISVVEYDRIDHRIIYLREKGAAPVAGDNFRVDENALLRHFQ